MTNYDEIKASVDAKLAEWNIAFAVSLVGETSRDEWLCDEWRVKLGSIETRYYTGTGHRKPTKLSVNRARFHGGRPEVFPFAPKAADVIHSLLSDAEAVNECFSDWCDNYGYSSDSIKALATYNACCEIGKNLRKVFTSAQSSELREMLQDF